MKPTIMPDNSIAADTNILIYLHDSSDERKRNIAENILAENPKIPAQVISEYINVARRVLHQPKADIVAHCALLLRDCDIIPVSCETLTNASTLIQKYDFQVFDSIVVASAIEANCSILYSEDMRHGLVIGSLTIVNPFL